MCRTPLTIVFLAAFLSAPLPALAHEVSSTQPPLPVSSIETPVGGLRFETGKPTLPNVALLPTPTVLSQKVASVYRGTDRVVAAQPPGPAPGFFGRGETGWRYLAALLGTLAIIGTIAARRYPAEKPQA